MDEPLEGLASSVTDLAQAQLSAEAGHHEWACFACHQAVESLGAIHLGSAAWAMDSAVLRGCHCCGDLADVVSDLEDRLRVLDALYIPTRYPDSLPEGAPTDHFGRLQSSDALSHARALLDAIRAALADA